MALLELSEWVSDPSILIMRMNTKENRITFELIDHMMAALDKIESREGVKGVVLTGQYGSKFFSNGLSFETLAAHPEELLNEFHKLMARLIRCTVPTIAAINGHCFAGGAMLALCCDFRVMTAEKGRFMCINEVEIGLPLTPGMNAVVTCKFPRSHWTDLVLLAKRYDGAMLTKTGVAQLCCAREEVETRAAELVSKASKKTPSFESYRDLKRQLWKAELEVLDRGGIGHAERIARLLSSGSGLLPTRSKI